MNVPSPIAENGGKGRTQGIYHGSQLNAGITDEILRGKRRRSFATELLEVENSSGSGIQIPLASELTELVSCSATEDPQDVWPIVERKLMSKHTEHC